MTASKHRNWDDLLWRRLNERVGTVLEEFYGNDVLEYDFHEILGELGDASWGETPDIDRYQRAFEVFMDRARRGDLPKDPPRWPEEWRDPNHPHWHQVPKSDELILDVNHKFEEQET